MARPCPHPRSSHAKVWAWLLVATFMLQAAMPMLASIAAGIRGLPVADICSVHGVRTMALDAGEPADHTLPAPDQQAGSAHCPLLSLAASAVLDTPLAAVLRHAPQRNDLLPDPPAERLVDASRRWLALRLHAPPAWA